MREHGWTDDHSSGDEGADDPIDLAALRADDALLDALAAGELRAPGGQADEFDPDDQLVAILATWVAGVRPEASPESKRPEPAAVAALPAQPAVRRRRPGYVGRWAAAAALALIALSGLAIEARQAHPGDTLWGVSRVFYAGRARSVEAADEISNALARARTALHEGRTGEAAQEITDIHARLATVRADEGHDELVRQHELLAEQLIHSPPTPAGPDPTTSAASADLAGSGARPSGDPGADAVLASPRDPTTQTAGGAPGTDSGQQGHSTGAAPSSQAGSTPPNATKPTSSPPDTPSTRPQSEGTPDGTTAPPAGAETPPATNPPQNPPSDNAQPSNAQPNNTQPNNTQPSNSAPNNTQPNNSAPDNSAAQSAPAQGTPATGTTARPAADTAQSSPSSDAQQSAGGATAPDRAAGDTPPVASLLGGLLSVGLTISI